MATRDSLQSQLEHLQTKYVGTGHADTTKYEWAVNQHRDSYASFIGHYHLLSYFSIAENAPVGRVRYRLLEKMIDPCGAPPPTEEEEAAAAAEREAAELRDAAAQLAAQASMYVAATAGIPALPPQHVPKVPPGKTS
ncbi:splicing factor 3B subunit 5 [Pelomyxa schiedti]|nr:splicing factor 3B subunit 5 [Pelomyxa schiedti]